MKTKAEIFLDDIVSLADKDPISTRNFYNSDSFDVLVDLIKVNYLISQEERIFYMKNMCMQIASHPLILGACLDIMNRCEKELASIEAFERAYNILEVSKEIRGFFSYLDL